MAEWDAFTRVGVRAVEKQDGVSHRLVCMTAKLMKHGRTSFAGLSQFLFRLHRVRRIVAVGFSLNHAACEVFETDGVGFEPTGSGVPSDLASPLYIGR